MPVHENGNVSPRGTHLATGLLAVLATLMIFLFNQLHNHESMEGHAGVLKITSAQQAEIDSLSYQASANRERLNKLEDRTERLAEEDARLAEAMRGMETIPSLVSRMSTTEANVQVLERWRDERIRQMIHPDDNAPLRK